jgi:hypothetical protein
LQEFRSSGVTEWGAAIRLEVLVRFSGSAIQAAFLFFAFQHFAPATPELLTRDSCLQSFSAFMAGVIIAADDGVEEGTQHGHTALD